VSRSTAPCHAVIRGCVNLERWARGLELTGSEGVNDFIQTERASIRDDFNFPRSSSMPGGVKGPGQLRRQLEITMLGAVAELERDLIGERLAMGLDRARRQKKRLASFCSETRK